jgi:IS30 family transposase
VNEKNKKINKQDRLLIEDLRNIKHENITSIARILKRTRKTIRNELKRCRGSYNAEKANRHAYLKQYHKTKDWMKILSISELGTYVESHMKLDWSPEEIAGRIRYVDSYLPHISTNSVYKYIYSTHGRQIEKYLRYGKKKRNKDYVYPEKIDNRVFIDKRPKKVEKRSIFGDWEADFICSGKKGKGYLLVFVERKTRFIVIKKINIKDMETVHRLFKEILGVQYIVNTLTLDNDIVFRRHEQLSKEINAPVYFTHPYHSWEKGTVENMNKWIRQYVKKSSDISKYTDEYIKEVEDKLNNRPRKCLQYKTPREAVLGEKRIWKTVSVIYSKEINNVDTFGVKCPEAIRMYDITF